MFCLTLVWNWFYAWITCSLGVFICYLLGFWFINLHVALCTFVFTCACVCVCVCVSRVGWSVQADKLSYRTPSIWLSFSTLTPSSMHWDRKLPGNTWPFAGFLWDGMKTCPKVNNTIFCVVLGPWIVLWIVWCLSRHGGVPSRRPSCKSR